MNRQRGFTLVQLMVAMVISLVVATAMVRLMANTLGTATRTIGMTRLTQELRTALQLMSRDVRRTGFSSEAIQCYANYDCAVDGSVALPGDISYNADKDCFVFLHDRNHDGDGTNDGAGAFRLATSDGVGVLEMWTGIGSANCESGDADWVGITDPAVVDVFLFQADDSPSYTEVIDLDAGGGEILQKVRKVNMRVGGRLIADPQIMRIIEDSIRVRNDVVL
jgi:prepilin peptidase dependent protein B